MNNDTSLQSTELAIAAIDSVAQIVASDTPTPAIVVNVQTLVVNAAEAVVNAVETAANESLDASANKTPTEPNAPAGAATTGHRIWPIMLVLIVAVFMVMCYYKCRKPSTNGQSKQLVDGWHGPIIAGKSVNANEESTSNDSNDNNDSNDSNDSKDSKDSKDSNDSNTATSMDNQFSPLEGSPVNSTTNLKVSDDNQKHDQKNENTVAEKIELLSYTNNSEDLLDKDKANNNPANMQTAYPYSTNPTTGLPTPLVPTTGLPTITPPVNPTTGLPTITPPVNPTTGLPTPIVPTNGFPAIPNLPCLTGNGMQFIGTPLTFPTMPKIAAPASGLPAVASGLPAVTTVPTTAPVVDQSAQLQVLNSELVKSTNEVARLNTELTNVRGLNEALKQAIDQYRVNQGALENAKAIALKEVDQLKLQLAEEKKRTSVLDQHTSSLNALASKVNVNTQPVQAWIQTYPYVLGNETGILIVGLNDETDAITKQKLEQYYGIPVDGTTTTIHSAVGHLVAAQKVVAINIQQAIP